MYEAIPLESEKYLRRSLIQQQAEANRQRKVDTLTGFVAFLSTLMLIPVMAYIIMNHEVWWPIVASTVKSFLV
ncbi:MAG: hypothetical protein AAF497_07625 [Planctomycetota bacterium]